MKVLFVRRALYHLRMRRTLVDHEVSSSLFRSMGSALGCQSASRSSALLLFFSSLRLFSSKTCRDARSCAVLELARVSLLFFMELL